MNFQSQGAQVWRKINNKKLRLRPSTLELQNTKPKMMLGRERSSVTGLT